MSKSKFKKACKAVTLGTRKRFPAILLGFGITGMGTAVVTAITATPKALILLEEAKVELDTDELTAKETVETVWKCYVPTAVFFTLSTACLIGSHSISTRRYAALMTAYALSESDLINYKSKVSEIFGEKKEKEVRDALAKDKMDANPARAKEIIITEKGKTLFFEPLSGRYFRSDVNEVKKAVNELNRRMLEETDISVNDFYYEIGLDNTLKGDEIGWNVYKGYIELDLSAHLSAEGEPCIYLGHYQPPSYDYRAF